MNDDDKIVEFFVMVSFFVDYTESYNDEIAQIIADVYRGYIETFSYDFE